MADDNTEYQTGYVSPIHEQVEPVVWTPPTEPEPQTGYVSPIHEQVEPKVWTPPPPESTTGYVQPIHERTEPRKLPFISTTDEYQYENKRRIEEEKKIRETKKDIESFYFMKPKRNQKDWWDMPMYDNQRNTRRITRNRNHEYWFLPPNLNGKI